MAAYFDLAAFFNDVAVLDWPMCRIEPAYKNALRIARERNAKPD